MYLLFHVCDFTTWHSYSSLLNCNIANFQYGVLCFPPVLGTRYWEILKKVYKNQLRLSAYSQLLIPQSSVSYH